MNRTRTVTTSTAALAATLTLGLAGPANAQKVTVTDAADATASLHDIGDVTAAYRAKKLAVNVSVTDLRATSDGGPASMSLFVDTNPRRRGPEFRLATGLQSGTDYQLVRMSQWKVSSDPLSCYHRVILDNAGDVVGFRIGRGCLGKPAKVRVGVKMRDLYDGSHPITDWLKHRRGFTPWLSRG